MSTPRFTLIGGPTVLIEYGGFRLLTDPTFDEPGEYKLPHVTLTKTTRPALSVADIGPVDAVLLSHDQHADNLDHAGREFLQQGAARVHDGQLARKDSAGTPRVLVPWQSATLTKPDGRSIEITAAPARHGPVGIEPLAGDVIGFMLSVKNRRDRPGLRHRRHGLV